MSIFSREAVGEKGAWTLQNYSEPWQPRSAWPVKRLIHELGNERSSGLVYITHIECFGAIAHMMYSDGQKDCRSLPISLASRAL